MTVVNFSPKGDIFPILGIRLCPVLNKLLDGLDERRAETQVKKLLNIKKERAIKFKGFSDSQDKRGTLVIVYEYFNDSHNPRLLIPETKDGYFNFKIYDVDYNSDVDLEKLITRIKKLSL